MIALATIFLIAIAVRLTRDRRGGGILPLALVILALAPIALVAWSLAEISRRWLARPVIVRRTLARLGLADRARGRTLTVERINQGDMNAVLLVTIEGGERIVLKHLLRFGTLLAWVAREFGATREYPRALDVVTRAIREVRAASRMRRAGIHAPRRLGFSLRHRVIAMEWIEGDDLAAALPRDPSLAPRLGTLLRAMHGVGIAMGDANPRNFAVDGAGRIVPFDLELTHLGPKATARKKGFDLAWAAAFLPDDESRARFLSGYGAPPAGTAIAIRRAEAHLLRFAPLIDWFARRWSGRRSLVTS
jgi:tRNA A-37 threonylcarbamoyl transferase component Bud32